MVMDGGLQEDRRQEILHTKAKKQSELLKRLENIRRLRKAALAVR